MSETNVASTEATQVSPEQELAEFMALSLGNGVIPQKTEETNTSQTSAEQNQNVTVSDPFTLIKDKFGYQTPEDALKEIEELRSFKANPTVAEITFENPESEKLFRAWQAGKKDEVYNYLEQDRRLERISTQEVTKETAAEVVKLGMQIKHKELTPDEIDYLFNKQFGNVPKPTQSDSDDDESYAQKVSAWEQQVNDRNMGLMIQAKLEKPEIQAAKGKLIVPEIEQSTDDGYLQYKKSLEEKPQIVDELKGIYKQFTAKSIETKLNFKDEANKIDFEFQYEPDQAGFAKVVEIAPDIDAFYALFNNPDGTPDRTKYLDAIYLITNKDKIISAAMKQAVNATIKASLPDNSNGGIVRQLNVSDGEPSELDRYMQYSGIKRQ